MHTQNALAVTVMILAMAPAISAINIANYQMSTHHYPSRVDTIKVTLKTVISMASGQHTELKPFKAGSKVRFQVMMTNTANEDADVLVEDTYHQNRPQLYKDGKLVSYRKEISEVLKWKDTDPDPVRVGSSVRLEPHKLTPVVVLDLSDWYEPLTPGSYQLSNQYRPQRGGSWTADSPCISFEVIP